MSSSLRRSGRSSNPPERFGFEGKVSSSAETPVKGSVKEFESKESESPEFFFELPDGRRKTLKEMELARFKLEYELASELPESEREGLIEAFDQDPSPWISSDEEESVEPRTLKKNDVVKLQFGDELKTGRVIHATEKMAQVHIYKGEVVWRIKTNLTLVK